METTIQTKNEGISDRKFWSSVFVIMILLGFAIYILGYVMGKNNNRCPDYIPLQENSVVITTENI